MQMVRNMKAIGKKISKMEKGNNIDPIVVGMKDFIKIGSNKEKDCFIGRMVPFFKEISLIMEQKDLEYIIGMMEENMKENGLEIK